MIEDERLNKATDEFFNDASGIAAEYWQACRALEVARTKNEPVDKIVGAIENVSSPLWALGKATPATPSAAAEMLGVALDALSPRYGSDNPRGVVATVFDGADILAIVGRVRDTMGLWEAQPGALKVAACG